MPINSIKIKLPATLAGALKNPQSLIFKRLQTGIEEAAIAIQGETKKNVIPGWNIGHQTKPKPYFTGRLNRSITYQMGRLKAIVGPNTPYAAIQEEGGTIRPKTAKALFVPTSVQGRKTGPVRGGNSGLTYGKDFIFMQRVEIKPKRYFERGIEAAQGLIMQILEKTVNEITGDAGFK